ncbi:hypothetical protein BGZ76_003952 [Entomortierella beljakovae]|nr:hypothetical protein BGZ76_003952 [Entomortierella beljakovae]
MDDIFTVFLRKPIADKETVANFGEEFGSEVDYVELYATEEEYRQWLEDHNRCAVFGVYEGFKSTKGEEYVTLYSVNPRGGCVKITWKSMPTIVDGLTVATTSIEEIKHNMRNMGTDVFDFL